MGKKHFTEEQIAFALRQTESRTSVAEIIRELGISEQTFFRWKKQFAGLGIAELGRYRDECLNHNEFLSLDEARAATVALRNDYNRLRPHGALGNQTTTELARSVDWHANLPTLHG